MNANHFIIKYASPEDIPALTAVERECFPAAEAASMQILINSHIITIIKSISGFSSKAKS